MLHGVGHGFGHGLQVYHGFSMFLSLPQPGVSVSATLQTGLTNVHFWHGTHGAFMQLMVSAVLWITLHG